MRASAARTLATPNVIRSDAKHGASLPLSPTNAKLATAAPCVLAELTRAEAQRPARLVVRVERRVQVHARPRPAGSRALDLVHDRAHAVFGQRDALTHVPGDVAHARAGVVGERRLGHGPLHAIDQTREPLAPDAALVHVAPVVSHDPSTAANHIDGAVLGDAPRERPLAHEDLGPPAGPARHGHEREPRLVQPPQRFVGGELEDPVGEKRVVEIEQHAPQPLCIIGREGGEGLHGSN